MQEVILCCQNLSMVEHGNIKILFFVRFLEKNRTNNKYANASATNYVSDLFIYLLA